MRARDWLFHKLTRPPFTDETGDKGWLAPFAHAPAHVVRRLTLTMPGWPRWSRPLRVAFLADFHVGSHTGDVARLAALVREVSGGAAPGSADVPDVAGELPGLATQLPGLATHLPSDAPDLVLLGGDFVNMIPFGGGRVPPHTVAEILGRLKSPLGSVAVLGNHDRNYGPEDVAKALRASDITVLFDSTHEVAFEGHKVTIAGIHDARRDRPAARAMLANLQSDQPTIVLSHDPWWFRHVPQGPHLVLAGHTHGGQICLPGGYPVRNASWAPLKWSYGLIEEPGRKMYVTSGLGCSALPLRLFMPPEWVMLELNGV